MLEALRQAWRDRDPSDLLSPMVVKEMRQGVRRNVFVGAMVILQALAVLALSVSISQHNREAGTWLFWTFVVMPLLIAPAAAGAVSVGEERKRNTLDPLLVTPLTARRIVFGKWCAAYAQTLLLACTLTPYVLLRYFLGGVDLFAELAGFTALIVGAGVLTAVNVAFANIAVGKAQSATGSGVGGSVVAILFVIFVVLPGIPMLGAVLVMGRSNPWGIVPALVMGVLTLVLILEGGALHLAHAAQKRPALLRGLALLTVPLARVSIEALGHDTEGVVWTWSIIVSLIAAITSVTEPRAAIVSVHEAWVGRGALRDLFGRVLAPGWVSGVGFATVLALFWCLAFTVVPPPSLASSSAGAPVWGILLVLAGVLMPVPLIRHFLPRAKSEIAAWFFFHLLAVVPAILGGLLFVVGVDDIRHAMPFLMAPSPWLILAWSAGETDASILLGVVVAAAWVVAAWYAAAVGWKETRRFVAERRPAEPASVAAEASEVLAS